jgi:ferredoxin
LSTPDQQFDERDTVFARENLVPGSPEFEEYYREHPELLEIDNHIRSLPGEGSGMHDADYRMFRSAAMLMKEIGSPQMVDGEPFPDKIELPTSQITVKIKAYSKILGADLIGISELNQAFVYSHRGRKVYPEEPYGSEIKLDHRFAISLGFREDTEIVRTGPYPSEMIETGAVYLRSAVVSVVLAEYIRSLGFPARAHHFRNYQVLPVPLAIDAGLGELGRCGFLITKEFGNCLRLSTVTTDLPLECDKPVDIGIQDFCNMCKLCADVCPSGAIPDGGMTTVRGFERWKLDEVKCINYWNKIGSDCGMCIGSCPWSLPDKWWHRLSTNFATKSHLARVILLKLYPIVFGKYKPRPMPDWMEPRKVT